MTIKVVSEHLNGLAVLESRTFDDPRGYFKETFNADLFRDAGLPTEFVQDNQSHSCRNVVRGLHFQWEPPQGKLVRVSIGTAWLVAVDIRKGSPSLGEWHGIEISADNHRMVWAPAGFARGFATLSDEVVVQYKCTGTYNPATEGGILWNDPAVGIEWPLDDALLSEKDAKAPTLEQWLASPQSDNFRF